MMVKKINLILVFSALFVFITSSALADKVALRETSLGKLTYPAVQGTHCVVKDTLDMRKNHFKYILHRRAETARLGERWSKKTVMGNFSLERCINCHARDAKGNPVKYWLANGKINPKHFCQTCHNYVAVKIDCFSCHQATPTGNFKAVSKLDNK